MKARNLLLLLNVCLLLAVGQAYAGYIAAPAGYTVQDAVFPIPYAWSVYGFDVLPSGDFVAFIDQNIVEVSRTGAVSAPLYSFAGSIYGSFVKVHGNTIYFGESSNGTIWSMGLDGSNPTSIGTIGNNYDLELNSAGQAFVSANPGWAGQKVFYFDGTGDEVVTGLSGYSGPLAFDGSDNLLYGTAYAAEGDWILRFDNEMIAGAIGGDPVTQADGQILASIDAPSDMVLDVPGNIYFTSGGILCRLLSGSSSAESFATSGYYLTTLRCGTSDSSLYVLVNGVTSDGNDIGVLSMLTPVPEPGSLLGLAVLLGLSGPAMLRLKRMR